MTKRKYSADEAKAQDIAAMGVPLGSVYHKLYFDVAWLHVYWNEYMQLFGTNPTRTAFLNKTASNFFRCVQESYWEQVILRIGRLTDNPKSCGRRNCSLKLLSSLVAAELRPDIEQLLSKVEEKISSCRDLRNKRIAHCSFDEVLNVKPIKKVLSAEVEEVLRAIDNTMNAVSRYYRRSITAFHASVFPNGAEQLLCILQDVPCESNPKSS